MVQYNTQSNKQNPVSPAGFTLITGGSMGIGRAMAEECAGRGQRLLLVALDTPELSKTAEELQGRFGIEIDVFPIDLTQPEAPNAVYEWCRSKGYVVNILINNAGFGTNGVFDRLSLERQLSMMRLNNQVVVEMTYRFLPMLREQSKAFILNMSSMEATLPIPYKAVYTGTKHFVYAFSLALRQELADTSVQVSVVCPGPTITNEEGLRRIQTQGKRARLLVMMPDQVAASAISGLLRGDDIIIPGKMARFIMLLSKYLPTRTKMSILTRMFRSYRGEGGE